MAHVRAHYGKVVVRCSCRGHRFTTTIDLKPTASNLRAARRIAEEAEHKLKAGNPWEAVRADLRCEVAPIIPNTLGYYAQHFLDHAEVERPTLMGYQSAYNSHWLHFDDRPITSLLRTELDAHLAAKKVTWKTRKNAVSVLRLIFDVAKRDGVLSKAPTDGWIVKRTKTKEPDPYSEKERDSLLRELKKSSPIAWRYFLMAFHSGMRTGELLGLEWFAVEKPYVHVRQERVRRIIEARTKTGWNRTVILPESVWNMMNNNPSRFQKSFVFLTPEGHPFRDADWLMDKWVKAHRATNVRRRTGPYPWRHTYISLALAHGAALLWVSKQTGHDMITMQKNYARWIPGRADADLAELEKVYT